MDARRPARALPAGPVPPRMPIRIVAALHTAGPTPQGQVPRVRHGRVTTITGMGLLDGKNIVITGVLTDASLAFGVAALAQNEGANVVLTGAGRALSLTERTARKLPQPVNVYELD